MCLDLPFVHRLNALPASLSAEHIKVLGSGSAFRLEHILSGDHASPIDFWYDQDEDEWVIVLSGSAELEFEEGSLVLGAGDAVLIPAHRKHRVTRSTQAVWLALHFSP